MSNHDANFIIGTLSAILAYLIGKVAYFVGGFDTQLSGLIAFMMIDYASGLLYAKSIHNLASKKSLSGIYKKFGMLLLVAAAYWLDVVFGDPDHEVMRNFLITLFVATEGISIVENLGKLGVPIPKFFKEALLTFQSGLVDDDDKKKKTPKGGEKK